MLDLGFELSQTRVDLGEETRLWVLIKLRASSPDDVRRAPINLSLVMDRSGSMGGDKLAFCQQAARFLVTHLSGDDKFSLVTFDHDVNIAVPPVSMHSKDGAVRAILGLRPGGSTNLSGGWLQGAARAEQVMIEGGINRVMLLTDGLANAGVTDPAAILKMTSGLAEKGVTTTTIGCGGDFNEDLLRNMADAGHGNYHYIATPEDAPTIFHRELAELLTIYAQNLRLLIRPSASVKNLAVLHDFPSTREGRDMELRLGDIFAGDEKVVLVEMVLSADRASQETDIGSLELSYQQVLGDVALRKVGVPMTVQREGGAHGPINPVVLREVLLCEAANELKEAVKEADAGDLEAARRRLANTTQKLSESQLADPQVEDQIEKLRELQSHYSDTDRYKTLGRKSTTSLSFNTLRQKGRGGRTVTPEMRACMRARAVVLIIGERLATTRGVLSVSDDFEGHSSQELMRNETFASNPALVWRWYEARQKSHANARPGPGHHALVSLMHRWQSTTMVSIATDSLLEDAGVNDILHLYGVVWQGRCTKDGTLVDLRPRGGDLNLGAGLPACSCGAPLRPAVPWVGEALDPAVAGRLDDALKKCESVVILGVRNLGEALGVNPTILGFPTRMIVGMDPDDPHQATLDFSAALAGY